MEKQPAITILDICEDLEEIEFTEMLKAQNPRIATLLDKGESLTDVTLTKKTVGQNTYTNVHATVSNKLRKELESSGDRVYIGLNSCRVEDKVNVMRCYRCHVHGHSGNNCKNDPVCGYCGSSEHESKDCKLKDNIYRNKNQLRCINCKRRNLDFHGHTAFWPSCPVNKHYRNKAKQSLPYYRNSSNDLN